MNFDDVEDGVQASYREFDHLDGTITRVIDLGLPSSHHLADKDLKAGLSDLHHIKIGSMRLVHPPSFIIRLPRKGKRIIAQIEPKIHVEGRKRFYDLRDEKPEDVEITLKYINETQKNCLNMEIKEIINANNNPYKINRPVEEN